MPFAQKVKNTLYRIVEEMSNDLTSFVKNPEKDFSRNRKLGFVQLIWFFLAMGSGCINHELLKHFEFDPQKTPSASAFLQQRAKLLPETFRYLLYQFNLQFPLQKFREKYLLIAADGSEFNIARNPSDPTTYHEPSGRSQKGFNMIHTISLYDLYSKRYLDLIVQPGKEKNEFSAFSQLVDHFAYADQPIFVADRGFASYNVFAHLLEKGYYFAIRAKDINVKRCLGVDALPEQLDCEINLILTRSNAKKKRLHPELEKNYRYICKTIVFDFISDEQPEYHMQLRVVRFQTADGQYENIITNLPVEEFPAEDIKEIYHLRWGIETSFRDLKHTIGTVNFHSKSPEYIIFEIFSRMTLYNFCTIITLHETTDKKTEKYVYQVNLSMAIKICYAFLIAESDADNIAELLSRYLLPIRLDRSYERRLRFRSPVTFVYRSV